MSAFEAVVRPVDVLQDAVAPQTIHLTAIVLDRPPGPDGILYDQSNIISRRPVSLRFTADDHRVMSDESAYILLKDGAWPKSFLLLLDEAGAPYAQGGIRTADGKATAETLEVARNRIVIRYDRRLG